MHLMFEGENGNKVNITDGKQMKYSEWTYK